MLNRLKRYASRARLRLSREYKSDLAKYKALYLERFGTSLAYELNPQLFDKTTTTDFDAHYTYQGPWVMRQLLRSRPKRHIDVGSWTPYIGFFAALQPTEFVDIRPADLDIPGTSAKSGSVLDLPYKTGSVESLSCLHVIEHIGLGRYGDPLDVEGTEKAARELARVIRSGGSLYVSLPVGKETTYFNAHRVTSPSRVVHLFEGLELVSFSAVTDKGAYKENIKPGSLSRQKYACGLYYFRKA